MAERRHIPHPRRASGRAAPVALVRPFLIGLLCIGVAVGARIVLERVSTGILPFLLTFPVAILGTLVAGAPAGAIATVGCQLLTLLFVLPHWSRDGAPPHDVLNFALATVSLALAVWATASHRRSAMLLGEQCEREVETLSLLVREIDHRTKNNFQIAAALLHTQAVASPDRQVREQIDVAAGRLAAMAAVYQVLDAPPAHDGALPLLAHVGRVCGAVRESLLPPGVTLAIGGDEVTVKASVALTIGLVVNEWLTNALKYAFPDRGGAISVRVGEGNGGIEVVVTDDGIGLDGAVDGTGSRLMASLVAALGGRTTIRSDRGTICTLFVPME